MTDQTYHHGRRVVVGVDGSPASARALRWATAQARLIDAVSAWQDPMVRWTSGQHTPCPVVIVPGEPEPAS